MEMPSKNGVLVSYMARPRNPNGQNMWNCDEINISSAILNPLSPHDF